MRTVKDNSRVKMYRDALDALGNFEKDALDRVRRINIVASELDVRGPRKGLNSLPDLSDPWYESPIPMAE